MNFPGKKVMPRFFVVAVLLGLVGVAVFFRACYIIFVEQEFWTAVAQRFVKTDQQIAPTRGNILAADGQVLAASIPEYRLFMDFMSWEKDEKRRRKDQHLRDSVFEEKIDSVCEGMHRLFPDIDPKEFKKHLRKGRDKKSHHWPLYKKRVSYIQYREAGKLPLFNLSRGRGGGFHADKYMKRKNPFGRLAIRTIGDLYGEIDSARCGLELKYDSILRGKPGRARRQKVLNRFLSFVEQPAENGSDLLTTLDVSMQDICEKALGDKLRELNANSGVCILMEVATGDVKAITSLTRLPNGGYYETQPNAVTNLYEPGSVFKPMSFMVAMDDGYITMDDEVDTGHGIMEIGGRRMKDHNWYKGGFGVLSVPMIIANSSNIGVSYLIEKHYGKNPEKFVDGLYRIGIAEDLHIPIPGYAKPRIRRPLPDGSNWSRTALPWMSIGYETQIPPISTLTFYNGVANGGKMVRPRFVKAIMREGQIVEEFPVEYVRKQMAKPEVVRNIQQCLQAVTTKGAGKPANSRMFKVAGKTGTAQVWTKAGFASQYLVSFVGYFPAQAPRYSCIVCIQKGGTSYGGAHCGPVFRRVAESIMAQEHQSDFSSARDTMNWAEPLVCDGNMATTAAVLEELHVPYQADFSPSDFSLLWGSGETTEGKVLLEVDEEEKGIMPDVNGYCLRDAVFRLEKLGLDVQVKGRGRVKRQSIAPGKPIESGKKVVLELGEMGKKMKRTPPPAPVIKRDTLTTDTAAGEQRGT